MAHIILVHGSCHGAWCWRDLIPALEGRGHSTLALDLPGMGADRTPIEQVTLDDYRDRIVAALSEAPAPAILLGHSAGGPLISLAAMTQPDKVSHLVYLCAYIPKTGVSMVERRKEARRQPLLSAVIPSDDRLSYVVDLTRVGEIFYGDCTGEQVEFAARNLRPQPVRPQATPVAVTEALHKLPKSYIRCARDGAIPEEFQAVMAAEWPEMQRYDLDSDHSPFFSHVAELADIIDEISRTAGSRTVGT